MNASEVKLLDLKTVEDCVKAIASIAEDRQNRNKKGKLRSPAEKKIEAIQLRLDRLYSKKEKRFLMIKAGRAILSKGEDGRIRELR